MIAAWYNPNFIDCYTVVIDEDVFAMSELPNHPQGINQFVGGLADRTPPLTKAWGEQVDLTSLPQTVQKAISERRAR